MENGRLWIQFQRFGANFADRWLRWTGARLIEVHLHSNRSGGTLKRPLKGGSRLIEVTATAGLTVLILIKTAKKTYSTGPFCNGQLSIHTCCVLHKMTCAGLSFVLYKETNFRQIKTSHFWYRRHLFHYYKNLQT